MYVCLSSVVLRTRIGLVRPLSEAHGQISMHFSTTEEDERGDKSLPCLRLCIYRSNNK